MILWQREPEAEADSRMTTAIRIRPDSDRDRDRDREPRLLRLTRKADPRPGAGFCAACWYVLPGCKEGTACDRCDRHAARLGMTAAGYAKTRPTPPHIAAMVAAMVASEQKPAEPES